MHFTFRGFMCVAGLAGFAGAASLAGVTLPDSVTVGGKPLVLNGIGIREASVFKVNVYVMGLYLESRSSNADAIVSSTGAKRVVQHYTRDLKQEDLVGAWKGSFEANNASLDGVRKEYETFLSYIVPLKKGQEMVIDFIEERVEISIAGRKMTPIVSAEFQKALLRVWLGPKPVYPPLKSAVLEGK